MTIRKDFQQIELIFLRIYCRKTFSNIRRKVCLLDRIIAYSFIKQDTYLPILETINTQFSLIDPFHLF